MLLGANTKDVQLDNPDNSLEEWSNTSIRVLPATEHFAWMLSLSSDVRSPISRIPSTKNFKPLSVGILPDDVCGE